MLALIVSEPLTYQSVKDFGCYCPNHEDTAKLPVSGEPWGPVLDYIELEDCAYESTYRQKCDRVDNTDN